MFTQTPVNDFQDFQAEKGAFVRRALSIVENEQKEYPLKQEDQKKKAVIKKRVMLSNYFREEIETKQDLLSAIREEDSYNAADSITTK